MELGSPSSCLFCKIVDGKIPAQIVHSSDDAVVFKDLHPQAPLHLLVIPKKHISSLSDATNEDQALLGKLLLTAGAMAKEFNVAKDGYRVNINTGGHGGQTVFHIHVHLLGGRLFHWPPG